VSRIDDFAALQIAELALPLRREGTFPIFVPAVGRMVVGPVAVDDDDDGLCSFSIGTGNVRRGAPQRSGGDDLYRGIMTPLNKFGVARCI